MKFIGITQQRRLYAALKALTRGTALTYSFTIRVTSLTEKPTVIVNVHNIDSVGLLQISDNMPNILEVLDEIETIRDFVAYYAPVKDFAAYCKATKLELPNYDTMVLPEGFGKINSNEAE